MATTLEFLLMASRLALKAGQYKRMLESYCSYLANIIFCVVTCTNLFWYLVCAIDITKVANAILNDNLAFHPFIKMWSLLTLRDEHATCKNAEAIKQLWSGSDFIALKAVLAA